MSIKNTQELRDLLLHSIEEVEKGNMEPKTASSIVGLSGQVIKSCMMDIAYAKAKAALNGKEVLPLALSSGAKK